MSISQHAAGAKEASRLFAVVLVLGGLAFYVWLLTWFVPRLQLHWSFTALLTITILAQTVTGLIPDSDSWKRKLHRLAAYTMAALYVPLGLFIVSADTIARSAKIVGILCLAYMLGAALLFLTTKRARSHFLLAQALYIVCFQVIILSAAYLP